MVMEKINGVVCFLGRGNVYPYLTKALAILRHRAWKGYVMNHDQTSRAISPKDITQEKGNTNVGLGYCLIREHCGEKSFPIHGNIYYCHDDFILEKINTQKWNTNELAKSLKCVDGDYAFAALCDENMVFARDPLGVKPLFIGRNNGLLGLATEAKALRAVGLEAQPVSPGFVYKVNFNGAERFSIKSVGETHYLATDLDSAAESVLSLVSTSIERRIKGRRLALGFSGGLDSSLLAALSSKHKSVRLVSVYVSGSEDEMAVKASAKLLGLDVLELALDSHVVKKMGNIVSQLIDSSNIMDLAIGIAINYAAHAASDEGCDGLILGQLADELFGGYYKYLRIYRDKGAEQAQAKMVNDTRMAHVVNFRRDEAAASPYSDLLLPYASFELADYALSLHPSLKIRPKENYRKIVLRRAALKAGLPKEIVFKPKKALQYSSDLEKIVQKHLL